MHTTRMHRREKTVVCGDTSCVQSFRNCAPLSKSTVVNMGSCLLEIDRDQTVKSIATLRCQRKDSRRKEQGFHERSSFLSESFFHLYRVFHRVHWTVYCRGRNVDADRLSKIFANVIVLDVLWCDEERLVSCGSESVYQCRKLSRVQCLANLQNCMPEIWRILEYCRFENLFRKIFF